jgi:hypothetical protein
VTPYVTLWPKRRGQGRGRALKPRGNQPNRLALIRDGLVRIGEWVPTVPRRRAALAGRRSRTVASIYLKNVYYRSLNTINNTYLI